MTHGPEHRLCGEAWNQRSLWWPKRARRSRPAAKPRARRRYHERSSLSIKPASAVHRAEEITQCPGPTPWIGLADAPICRITEDLSRGLLKPGHQFRIGPGTDLGLRAGGEKAVHRNACEQRG